LFYMSRAFDGREPMATLILGRIREEPLPQPPKVVVLSKKEIGRRVRAARQVRGITQVELAKTLGTYQTVVSAIERGVRGLTIHQVARLASALGASLDELLGSSSHAPSNGQLKDRRFLRRLQKIEQLPKRDQQALLRTIDAFLSKVS
jgi:transcriptional regulator with XRE-family HTH domain